MHLFKSSDNTISDLIIYNSMKHIFDDTSKYRIYVLFIVWYIDLNTFILRQVWLFYLFRPERLKYINCIIYFSFTKRA